MAKRMNEWDDEPDDATPSLAQARTQHYPKPQLLQWRPIETAPKGVFLLLCCPSGYKTTEFVYTTGIMHSDYKQGRWVDHADDDLSDWGMEPTHWMELPTPPNKN